MGSSSKFNRNVVVINACTHATRTPSTSCVLPPVDHPKNIAKIRHYSTTHRKKIVHRKYGEPTYMQDDWKLSFLYNFQTWTIISDVWFHLQSWILSWQFAFVRKDFAWSSYMDLVSHKIVSIKISVLYFPNKSILASFVMILGINAL